MMNASPVKFFSDRNYILTYHDIDPIWRRKTVYATAAPLYGGGWCVFESKEHMEKYIAERTKNERIGI